MELDKDSLRYSDEMDSCPFPELLTELRNTVYEFSFFMKMGNTVRTHRSDHEQQREYQECFSHVDLLLANKQPHWEGKTNAYEA